jgi:hypothetical protein
LPVLAIPIVNMHALTAVVSYGAHLDHTLPDPDEIRLLNELAKASAVSYQQAKLATLRREIAELTRDVAFVRSQNAEEKARNERLEESLRALTRGPAVT